MSQCTLQVALWSQALRSRVADSTRLPTDKTTINNSSAASVPGAALGERAHQNDGVEDVRHRAWAELQYLRLCPLPKQARLIQGLHSTQQTPAHATQ